MAHDLIIKNGLIVDGTGSEPYMGDVLIDEGTITAIGKINERAVQEINADGAVVSPGFIDLHTHLDAQVGWDPFLTPSSQHGVTTALMGNCAVTFAPCKPEDREFLATMMERVEDIPREAIMSGLPWDWQTYGEYLDSVEKMRPAINVTGMVGHSAVRYYVMGDRGIDENPNADEIARIADLVGQSVRGGAIGFSTNRLPQHRVPDGRSIPGTHAVAEELIAIAKQVGAANGLFQMVPFYKKEDIAGDLDLLGRIAIEGKVRGLFSATETEMYHYDDPHHIIEHYRELGAEIYGTTVPRCGGNVSNLQTVIVFPGWNKLLAIAPEKRWAAIQDEAFRNELIDAARNDPASRRFARRLRWMGDGDRPIYTKGREDNLDNMAIAAQEHPAETWLRMMLETGGKATFHMPFFNLRFDAVETLMNRDWIVPGLGDAGAHVSVIMDSGWPSFFLSHWVRDEKKIELPIAIHRMTARAAKVLGLNDRGMLKVGMKADINVLDIDNVEERHPRVVQDFPHGKSRLVQDSAGYLATVVNGQIIRRDGESTGVRSGRVLRSTDA
jgi:N-acyl-D-amino-acid deacylase